MNRGWLRFWTTNRGWSDITLWLSIHHQNHYLIFLLSFLMKIDPSFINRGRWWFITNVVCLLITFALQNQVQLGVSMSRVGKILQPNPLWWVKKIQPNPHGLCWTHGLNNYLYIYIYKIETFEALTIFHITINFFLKRINPTILYLSRLPS